MLNNNNNPSLVTMRRQAKMLILAFTFRQNCLGFFKVIDFNRKIKYGLNYKLLFR